MIIHVTDIIWDASKREIADKELPESTDFDTDDCLPAPDDDMIIDWLSDQFETCVLACSITRENT